MKRFDLMLGGLLVGLTIGPPVVRAGCPDRPASQAEAKKLAGKYWRVAERFFAEGLYEEAMNAFICSFRMVPHALTTFNIAKSADKAKKYQMALRYYRAFLRIKPSSRDGAEVKKRIRELEARSSPRPRPRIRPRARPRPIQDLGPQPGAVVQPGTRPDAGTQPGAAVQPGTGPSPVARAEPGTRIGAAPRPRETTPGPAPVGTGRPWWKMSAYGYSGWGSVAVGGILVITGVALGGLAGAARARVTGAEEGTNWYNDLKKPYDSYQGNVVGAGVCVGLGLAAVATGAFLLVWDRRLAKKERLSIAPAVLPGGAMLSLGGRF